MNKKFLQEAIADAQTVKASAIANAKAALTESFTPQIQSMLSAKLQEMEQEDLEEVELNEIELDEEEINLNELESENSEGIVSEVEEEEEVGGDGSETVEDEIIDLENMSDEDLTKYIESVVGEMVANGEIEAGENAEDDMEYGGDDEELDLEMSDDEAEMTMEAETEAGEDYEKMDGMEKLKSELEEVKTELYEAYNAVKKQKDTLNEINLLNSKLLFTNKLFKAKNLSEASKLKVIGSFDRATTINESKLVYETLKEGLMKSETSNSHAKKQMIGLASKAVSNITESVQPKTDIIETDPQILRMQKLAGII